MDHFEPVMELRSSLVDQEEFSITLIFEDVEFEVGNFVIVCSDDSVDLFMLILEVIDVQFAAFHENKDMLISYQKNDKQINS